jgi:heat shock protein HspQ
MMLDLCRGDFYFRARIGKAFEASRAMEPKQAKFVIGQVVKHRVFPFRGVIFDVDPEFANSEEWWLAIPEEIRPHKDQPFYHLLAENAQTHYFAYVSQQNLQADESGEPVAHPEVQSYFDEFRGDRYMMRPIQAN